MRHRVTLQRRAATQDAAGGVRNVWADWAVRWAALERTPGREVWASAQANGRVPAVFRLRFLSGVLPGMRLLHGGKVFNVLSAVDTEGRKEELLLTCEEWVEETP